MAGGLSAQRAPAVAVQCLTWFISALLFESKGFYPYQEQKAFETWNLVCDFATFIYAA